MKEIQFKLYGQTKKVYITKDIVNKLVGAIFILASAILLGIFELFKLGWDLSTLQNPDFWSAYFIKLAMLYLAFFGAYIWRRASNLKNPKIIIPREILKHNKKLIADNYKTSDCEQWLKYVWNYKKKLALFKSKIQQINSKLNLIEPTEPVAKYKELKSFAKIFKPLLYIKHQISKFIYNRLQKKFKKKLAKREYYENQLKLIDTHEEIIALYRSREYTKAKSLYKTIEKQDAYKFFMPHFKELNFKKLFNVNIEQQGSNDDNFDYNEAKVLFEKIVKTIGFGCIFLAIITSIILEPSTYTWIKLIYIALNLILMLWYIYNGVKTADKFVFGNVANADNDRIKVCDEYRDDCILINQDWAKEFKSYPQDEETPPENQKTTIIPTQVE